MDQASSTPIAEEIDRLFTERLFKDGGLSDSANANRMTIEDRTIEEVDRVTRLVMDELLAKQTPEVTVCPKCGGPTHDKPAQHRSLQNRRGKVNFNTAIGHCEACRLDIFRQMRTLQCDVDHLRTRGSP